ncbi:cation-transporting P-type ATPase [Lacticaseibacillus camelliae]|uniref:cation-transporting P-type ATPase n=1 Tax=Lacticaseibacillus camelliae TaxID=381742 RepID=UPI0009EB6A7F
MAEQKAFYAITNDEALKRLQTNEEAGLSAQEAQTRLAQNGRMLWPKARRKRCCSAFWINSKIS